MIEYGQKEMDDLAGKDPVMARHIAHKKAASIEGGSLKQRQ